MEDEKMSGSIGEAIKMYFERAAQELLDKALAMEPVLVGEIHRQYPEGTGYTFYEELGTPPNTIDSTATVIDENVKALPAPEVQG